MRYKSPCYKSSLWLISCVAVVLLGLPADRTLAQTAGFRQSLAVSDEPVDLLFPEPKSVLDIYRSWGRAFGIQVLFDPKIKDSKIVIELHDATALKSLRILNKSAAHFFVQMDERTILVADDTPQNRRTYKPEVIQAFALQDIELKDAIVMVRSLIGAKNVAAGSSQNLFVLRDTADKARVVEELLRILDKPRAEAAIDVEVFHLDGRRRDDTAAKLRRGGGGRRGGRGRPHGFPQRLPTRELEHLRGAAQTLADPTLNVLSGDKGRWSLVDSFDVSTEDGVTHLEIGFTLELEVRVKAASGAVEFQARLVANDVTDSASAGPVAGIRTTEWSARLDTGESLLFSGFLRTGRKSVTGDPGSLFVSFFEPLAKERGEILIALTPRIVREPGFTERDLAPLCVGTETNISFEAGCGLFDTSLEASH